MSLLSTVKQHRRVYAVNRIIETAYGTYTGANQIRVPLVPGAGFIRADRDGPNNEGHATGFEYETEHYPERRVVGGGVNVWASIEALGLTFGYGLGHDTKSTVAVGNILHTFTPADYSSKSASVGYCSQLQSADNEDGSGTTVDDLNGMQLNDFTLSFARSGHPTIDWNWVGATKNNDGTINTSVATLIPKDLYVPNNKVSYFLSPATSEHIGNWAGSVTQPTSGSAVTSSDLISSLDITSEVESLTLNHNNNLDIDASYGAGTASGAGATKRESYYTMRQTTGSIVFRKRKAVADLANAMANNYSGTSADQKEYTLQIIGTTDKILSSGLNAAFSIVIPLLRFESFSDDTQTDPTGTANFKVTQDDPTGSPELPIECFVWDAMDTVYNQA